MVINATCMSGLTGLIYGGYLRSRDARIRFMAENKHEMFRHPREAQAAMVDRMVLSFVRGGCSLGWRMGLLALFFTGAGLTLTVARNAVNPLDHAAAGAATGAVYRLGGGPRAAASGAAAGSALGLAAGATYWVLEMAAEQTIAERMQSDYEHQRRRRKMEEDRMREEQDRKTPRFTANLIFLKKLLKIFFPFFRFEEWKAEADPEEPRETFRSKVAEYLGYVAPR